MSDHLRYPVSPLESLQGLYYFPRMCDKIRLHNEGKLAEDYTDNLGRGMDLWLCQFLQIEYPAIVEKVLSGASNEETLNWVWQTGRGQAPASYEIDWINSYIRNRGNDDDMSGRLAFRKEELGIADRQDIRNFADFIDFDEGRIS